jgi:heavy metal sensor kinase
MLCCAACLVASLVLFGAAVYVVFGKYLLHEVDRALAEELPEVIAEVGTAPQATLAEELRENFAGHDFYIIQVVAPDGTLFFSTPKGLAPLLSNEVFARDAKRFEGTVTSPDGSWLRVRSERVRRSDGEYLVIVGDPMEAYLSARRRLLATLFTLGPLAALLTIAGSFWLSGRAFAPVDRLTQTALSITASGLHERVPQPEADDEIGRLAQAFNTMIGRLEQAFTEVRRFTADAAHELRTPLAVLRTGAEVALRSHHSSDQYRQVLHDQLDEIGRLSRLTDQLLFLCRDDAGLNDEAKEDVRVDTLLEELCETMQLSAEAKGITLACLELAPAVVSAPPDRLRRLVLNLLDNALRHTPSGGRVGLRASADDRVVRIEIDDTGCGISAEQLPRVFDRFYRGDASRVRSTGGSGLGLSICRSIVESLGGLIRLQSEVGAGTAAIVELPGERVGSRSDLELPVHRVAS